MPDSIASLSVKASLNSAALTGGLADATTKVKAFASSAKSALGSLSAIPGGGLFAGLAGGLGAAGFAASITSGLDKITALDSEAKKLGVSFRDAATFQQLAGDRGEAFTHALAKMEEGLGKARAGGDDFSKKLQQLGLDADKVTTSSPAEAYKQIADKIAGMGNAYDRAAAIQEIFGKGGKEITDIILRGGAGFDVAAGKVDRYGRALSDAEVLEAKAAKRAMADLSSQWEGLQTKLSATFAPTLSWMTKSFTEGIEELKHFPEAFSDPNKFWEGVRARGEASKKALPEPPELSDTDAKAMAQKDNIDKLTETYQKHFAAIVFGSKDAELALAKEKMLTEGMDEKKADSLLAPVKAIADQVDALERVNQLHFAGLNLYDQETAKIQAIAGVLGENVKAFEAQRSAAEKMLPILEANRAMQVKAETQTPQERFKSQTDELSKLKDKGKLDGDTYGRAFAKMAKDLISQAGITPDLKLASIATAGSSAALQFQGQLGAQGQVGSMVEQFRSAVEVLTEQQREQTRAAEELLAFFQQGGLQQASF